jgi:hypothetical protein
LDVRLSFDNVMRVLSPAAQEILDIRAKDLRQAQAQDIMENAFSNEKTAIDIAQTRSHKIDSQRARTTKWHVTLPVEGTGGRNEAPTVDKGKKRD